MFPSEQEVILLPYSYLRVVEVRDQEGVPAYFSVYVIATTIVDASRYVKLREIHVPRGLKVVFWVDDNPQNNFGYIWELERIGIP